jgi:hypothetical protein
VALGEDFEAVQEFQEGIYASFLSRDLALLSDLLKKLAGAERSEAWQVLRTFARPYLLRNRGTDLSATSDFVLDDLGPFVKNMGRFLNVY